MKEATSRPARSIGFAVLALTIVGFLGGCQGKKSDEPKPADQQEIFTLDVLKPILGEARDDASGIIDVTGDAGELIISYRYYDVDLKNYDDDLVRELAPKIEAMYKTFKTLDRVVFQLKANDPLSPGAWKPYANFALNRKIVDRLEWSGILTADFFNNVIELHRFD